MRRKGVARGNNFLFVGPILPAHDPTKPYPHSEISTWPDIGPSEGEHQIHVRGPAPKTSHRRNRGLDFIISELGQGCDWQSTRAHRLCQGLQVTNFLARQPCSPQSVGSGGKHRLGLQRTAHCLVNAPGDGCCRFCGQLLPDDNSRQGRKGVFTAPRRRVSHQGDGPPHRGMIASKRIQGVTNMRVG